MESEYQCKYGQCYTYQSSYRWYKCPFNSISVAEKLTRNCKGRQKYYGIKYNWLKLNSYFKIMDSECQYKCGRYYTCGSSCRWCNCECDSISIAEKLARKGKQKRRAAKSARS